MKSYLGSFAGPCLVVALFLVGIYTLAVPQRDASQARAEAAISELISAGLDEDEARAIFDELFDRRETRWNTKFDAIERRIDEVQSLIASKVSSSSKEEFDASLQKLKREMQGEIDSTGRATASYASGFEAKLAGIESELVARLQSEGATYDQKIADLEARVSAKLKIADNTALEAKVAELEKKIDEMTKVRTGLVGSGSTGSSQPRWIQTSSSSCTGSKPGIVASRLRPRTSSCSGSTSTVVYSAPVVQQCETSDCNQQYAPVSSEVVVSDVVVSDEFDSDFGQVADINDGSCPGGVCNRASAPSGRVRSTPVRGMLKRVFGR